MCETVHQSHMTAKNEQKTRARIQKTRKCYDSPTTSKIHAYCAGVAASQQQPLSSNLPAAASQQQPPGTSSTAEERRNHKAAGERSASFVVRPRPTAILTAVPPQSHCSPTAAGSVRGPNLQKSRVLEKVCETVHQSHMTSKNEQKTRATIQKTREGYDSTKNIGNSCILHASGRAASQQQPPSNSPASSGLQAAASQQQPPSSSLCPYGHFAARQNHAFRAVATA